MSIAEQARQAAASTNESLVADLSTVRAELARAREELARSETQVKVVQELLNRLAPGPAQAQRASPRQPKAEG